MANFKTLILISGIAVLINACSTTTESTATGLGQPVLSADLAAFDLVVGPDGSNLPAGSGTANQGEAVYQAKCQSCHGNSGQGMTGNTQLVGGSMQSAERPLRTVGSYWPYSTTVFDFIRRAMPANAPKSLSNDEVYQVTAYLLYLNGIVERDAVLNAQSLPNVAMPNQAGFIDQSHLQ